MVKSGQPTATAIRPVDFDSRLHPNIPVEVVERRDLIERIDRLVLARPERVSFTTVMLVRSGTGTHTIDFESVPLAPGRLVRVLPGQVQSWDLRTDVEVTAVLSASPLATAAAVDDTPARDLDPASLRTIEALIDVIRTEQHRYAGDEASNRLLRGVVEAVHAVFERAAPEGDGGHVPEAYSVFRSALERDLGSSHSVKDYARTLGYSERTLSRACQAVTGLSAKGVLTQRLVLEAKRQLAHSDLPVRTIGSQLGFSEATNFHKFFVRETGTKPSAFRESSRRHR